ncbi:MAG TPA: malto-oligosyltrehalose synthase [Solirubrobacteraceae bacterium]|jgi:(1->4)-alpha-D-glucan 1-alpha-D-glucosylmutase|nr:malto-oligosyltrehalose synthase [Solirubrobacteraceae bacterium]
MMRATYRLQLTGGFGFDRARELVSYLGELGISHLYLSPIMQARAGSTHGYDVVDPTRVSDELGGEEGFRRLAGALHDAGMGVIVDFVPNHMATSDENPYWSDPERRAKFFDVDPRTGWHRRFFTIDDLAGVRVEDPEVFEETHGKVLELVSDGLIDGLRIDHPDGLAEPATYLERLAERGVELVWVEKILEAGEQLRDWPVQGTTGYEFANDVTALFVDPRGEAELTDLYAAFIGHHESFAEVADRAKREQAATAFQPEVGKLRSLYDDPELEAAVASLHVYRSYVQPYTGRVEDADRQVLRDLPEDLRRILLLEEGGHEEFVVRFQQTTGPVMAKGVEDTAFYRYLRLTALNEVGGDPGRFSLAVEEFHRANLARAVRFPEHMLASQTHDTKRSGDVRARIGALAGFATEWRELVLAWHEANEPLRTGPGPDANEEYLIYQTLLGAWPIEQERLGTYLEKALREAKVNTGWDDPHEKWERSVIDFAAALYDHRPFRESFDPFVDRVAEAGEAAALGAVLLKLTCPGVPDIYQGDELWALNLVDPDNRRPVDWEERRQVLEQIKDGALPDRCGRKLFLIREALALRTRRPGAFAGAYALLSAPDDVCAFTRGDDVAVIVGLRADTRLDEVALPSTGWRELLPRDGAFATLRLLEAP